MIEFVLSLIMCFIFTQLPPPESKREALLQVVYGGPLVWALFIVVAGCRLARLGYHRARSKL